MVGSSLKEQQKAEWKRLMEDSCRREEYNIRPDIPMKKQRAMKQSFIRFRDPVMNVDYGTFQKQFKQFMEHPNKAEHIDWKDASGSIANGWTMLFCAMNCKRLDIAEILLEHGADINLDNMLLWATEKGHNDTVTFLLDKGADINTGDYNGKTPLMFACESWRKLDCTAELLLERGADIHIADNEGGTALLRACNGGCPEILKILLDKGADFRVTNNEDRMTAFTALMVASRAGCTDSVRLLLDKGADITIADKKGTTALMEASSSGHTKIVELLLERGADINVADKYGRNAMGHASMYGRTDIVKLLLERGAG